MAIAAALDEIPKPVWLALMVLGFIFFWPAGLAILAFLLWSGRMGCWRHAGAGWHGHMSGRWQGMRRGGESGNTAFDEYRAETLRRLEDEEREFRSFLDRLRRARDKAEFDQFLAERRNSSGPQPQE
jgi:hypothetical protein